MQPWDFAYKLYNTFFFLNEPFTKHLLHNPQKDILNKSHKPTIQNRIAAVPCDFTFVDIQASFGHVSHASLGLLGGEGVEVVNKRRLIGDLKVPNAAVTLRTHGRGSESGRESKY